MAGAVVEYPEAVRALMPAGCAAALDAGTPNSAVRPKLERLRADDFLAPGGDRTMAEACLAGLWLLHDFLVESHRLSQEIETPTGSFWHAIMHRREGDFENAKYWLRRVGKHPTFAALATAARDVIGRDDPQPLRDFVARPEWDPYGFVDLCRSACNGRAELSGGCRRIQAAEWQVLFDYCVRSARGEG
jgi:hypothetical protein